jgi:hypothetical protein
LLWRSISRRWEALGFELDDPKAPVIWRYLRLWDNGSKRGDEVAALLGLP